jgi:hypothetical protein
MAAPVIYEASFGLLAPVELQQNLTRICASLTRLLKPLTPRKGLKCLLQLCTPAWAM